MRNFNSSFGSKKNQMTALTRRKLTRSPLISSMGYSEVKKNSPKAKTVLLPPKTDNKLTVIFDLDETLIHTHVNETNYSDDIIKINVDGKEYITSVRPGVRSLLNKLAGKYELILYTASEECYASQIIKNLESDCKIFDYKLYQNDCKFKFGRLYKSLSHIGRDNNRTLVFDDSEIVWNNEERIFKCKPYSGGNDDKEVERIQHIIETVSEKENLIGKQSLRLI